MFGNEYKVNLYLTSYEKGKLALLVMFVGAWFVKQRNSVYLVSTNTVLINVSPA